MPTLEAESTGHTENPNEKANNNAPEKKESEFLDKVGETQIPEDVIASLEAFEKERAEIGADRKYATADVETPKPPKADGKTQEDKTGKQLKGEVDIGKRHFDTEQWDSPKPSDEDVLISDGLHGLPESPIQTLNAEARKQPDPYSAEHLNPQPDGGQAGIGAAEMYARRMKDLREEKANYEKALAEEAEKARKQQESPEPVETDEDLEVTVAPGSFIKKEGEEEAPKPKPEPEPVEQQPRNVNVPRIPTFCILNSDNGKTLRDAQDHLKATNPELYKQTRFVAAYHSQEKLEQVRDSGIFKGHQVEFHLVDKDEPVLPDDAVMVIVSDLEQRAPHSLVKNPTMGNTGENQTETYISGRGAMVYYNPKTGQVEAVQPSNLLGYNTLETEEGTRILRSNAQRRMVSKKVVEGIDEDDPNALPAYSVSLGKHLRNNEPAAYAYMSDKKPLWPHNYSPEIPEYMKAITTSADPNAVILTEAVPLRRQEIVLTAQEDIEAYLNGSDKRPYDVIEQDDLGKVKSITLPNRYDPRADNWDGYVYPHPRGEVVAARGKELVRYVVEADQLYDAVSDVAPHATISGSPNVAGQFGYMIFDLNANKQQAVEARRTFGRKISELTKDSKAFLFKDAQEQLATHWDKESSADLLEKNYAKALEKCPQIAKNYNLAIDMAELYFREGLPQRAVPHLLRAAKLMPLASAPDTLLARIHLNNTRYFTEVKDESLSEDQRLQAAQNELTHALKSLERGMTKSPDNGEIYQLGVELLQKRQAIFEQQRAIGFAPTMEQERQTTARCIELMQEQVRTKEMLPEDSARLIHQLCVQLRHQSDLYQGDTSVFKTVLVHNIETGERTLKEITVEEFMREQAARQIRHAWSTAEDILEGGWLANPERVTNLLRNQIIGEIADEWERIRPRGTEIDPEGVLDPARPWLQFTPLPDAEWATTPDPDQVERWIYVGEMTDSDEVAPVDILRTLQATGATLEIHSEAPIDTPSETTGEQVSSAEEAEEDKDFFLGTVMEHNGRPLGGNFSIPLDILNSHALIVGATGSGKSTAIKLILEQCNGAGVRFCVVEAGQKPGEFYDMSFRLEGAAEVVTIRPGLDNISYNLFMPTDGPPETEIQRVKECVQLNTLIWTIAYQMNNPFDSIFRTTLTKLFAEHGWETGDPDFPATSVGQTVPTLKELKERFRLAVEVYNKSQGQKSDSGATISGFFDTRTDDQLTFMQNLVESGQSINLVELIKNKNVVLRFDHFVREDDRNLAVSMTLAIIANGLIQERGTDNNNILETLLVLEEARGLLKDHGPNDEKGAARMGALAVLMTQLRSSGVGVAISTQTMDIHRDFRSQPALTIVGRAEDEDAAILASKLAPTDDDREEMAQRLGSLERGHVFVKSKGKVTRVLTAFDQEREDAIKARVKQAKAQAKVKEKQAAKRGFKPSKNSDAATVELVDDVGGLAVAPPIDRRRFDRYRVTEEAKAPEQAWLRTFARAAVLGCVASEAGMTMPTKVPEELQQRWNRAVAEDPERAQKLLATVVGRAVTRRVHGIKHKIHPRAVALTALATTAELLNSNLDDAAKAALAKQPIDMSKVRYLVSSYFTPPQITWINEYSKLASPHGKDRPNPRSRAQPLTGSLPNYSERKPKVRVKDTAVAYQTVGEQTEQMRAHPHSPLVQEKNREIQWVTLNGNTDEVKEILADDRLITGSDPSQISRRRRIAHAMGYCGLEDHEPSAYEKIRTTATAALNKNLKPAT